MHTYLFRALSALLVCALAATLGFPAFANETLGLVTGPKTGTYYAVGKDIAQTSNKSGVDVDVKDSEGSIDNIKRINSREKASLGIVQSDVLGFLSRSKNPDSMRMASNLRMVFPLYDEEVHILTRRSIRSLSDLNGKKVAIGQEGSGNMLTAINLFAMMGIEPAEIQKIPCEQGVVGVLKGNLDAAVFVGGKPVRMFKNLEDLALPANKQYAPMMEQVHFLPLDSPKMLEEYKPAELTSADYTFMEKPVKTISVQAVLVSYDFSDSSKQRCASLAKLAKIIRSELPELKKTGHPKWKEVNLDAATGIWKKDGCAWPVAAASSSPESSLGDDLVKVIETR